MQTHRISSLSQMSMLMRSPSKGKPPLPESVSRIPRRSLRSSTATLIPTTPVSTMKPHVQSPVLRPEYRTISYEIRALAKMVEDEFGDQELSKVGITNDISVNHSVVYERGRFYEEYSARRNERLRRKKGETGEKKNHLGVTVESGKKRGVDAKKMDSLRKSVPGNFSACKTENPIPRYSLRSNSKENWKPTETRNLEWSGIGGERKIGARRVRKL